MKQKRIYFIVLIIFIIGCLFLIGRHVKEGFDGPSDKALVIVEPRSHKDLARVINNFDSVMPNDWDLYVFHGKSNGAFAAEATEGLSGRTVKLIPLETDNLNADSYNKLFKQESFWNQIDAETIFVFQTDTALCKNTITKLEEFLNYDYIGCSVNNEAFGLNTTPWWGKLAFYGIGGLSIRKKSFTLKCIKDRPVEDKYPEDVFFSECVHNSPNKPESAEVLGRFCTQNTFFQPSFGAHKTTVLKKEHQEPFYRFCPESKFMKED